MEVITLTEKQKKIIMETIEIWPNPIDTYRLLKLLDEMAIRIIQLERER